MTAIAAESPLDSSMKGRQFGASFFMQCGARQLYALHICRVVHATTRLTILRERSILAAAESGYMAISAGRQAIKSQSSR